MNFPDLIARTIQPVSGTLCRVVESQEQVATTSLVDDLDEQAVIEGLLEDVSKPPQPPGCESLHYLLATPFRYPPLRYGSRFGRFFEPSIFYGGSGVEVTLAEVAYYRCLFLADMDAPPSNGLMSQHHLFTAGYRLEKGLRLQGKQWRDFHEALTHPSDYSTAQQLGTAMREGGVDGFEYLSARGRQACMFSLPYSWKAGAKDLNVGIFAPDGLADQKPRSYQRLIVRTTPTWVQFSLEFADGQRQRFTYDAALFQVDGALPMPAGVE